MERRAERLDLRHQLVGQLLSRDNGQGGNVIDRLFGIKLRALTAGPVQNVDQMRLHIQKAEFEDCEKPHRPRADNDCVCIMFCHHAPEICENRFIFKGFCRIAA
jgi:hypothetical protein